VNLAQFPEDRDKKNRDHKQKEWHAHSIALQPDKTGKSACSVLPISHEAATEFANIARGQCRTFAEFAILALGITQSEGRVMRITVTIPLKFGRIVCAFLR
jgi:hypothetical protein